MYHPEYFKWKFFATATNHTNDFRLYKISSSKCCVIVLKTSFVLILREMLGAAENMKSSNKILTETISKRYFGK